MSPEQNQAFRQQVMEILSRDPVVSGLLKTNSPDAIFDAYTNNDWSGVINITGQPFSKQQQEAAVARAGRDLAPAYRAMESFDRDVVEQSLAGEQTGFDQFRRDEARAFSEAKRGEDQNAADQGILFAGSRFQRNNNLRDIYRDREAQQRGVVGSRMTSTARDYQYKYGDTAAKSLKDLYGLRSSSTFNANQASGPVTAGRGIMPAYNPTKFKFQGTAPVTQSAAVQQRAAGLLTNRANKLTTMGYNNKL